jgi:hypothetical protein
MTGIGRNIEEKQGVLEQYIGEYIIITPPNGTSHSGRLDRIEDPYAVLNPYQGANWDSEEGITRILINGDQKIFASPFTDITPTTKENIEAFCNYHNKKDHESNGNNRSKE